MQMIPVESSNIAAIGFENALMRIEFRDGSRYDYPNVAAADHAGLMEAKSKGQCLANLQARGAIGRGIKINGAVPGLSRPVSPGSSVYSSQVHVSQEEGCCGVFLNKASLAGKLDALQSCECPTCGVTFRRKAYGDLVFWQPEELAALIR